MDSHGLPRWLTLGANLAVLAGIVLLIVELNQNRDMMRAQIRHELSVGIVDLLLTPASSEQLADLMLRAQAGEALTLPELFQFQMRTNALFRYWEDVHYQYRIGLYDDSEFDRQKQAWKGYMANTPPGARYWCQVRNLYSEEFKNEMDSLLPDICREGETLMHTGKLRNFANRYTDAWNSQDPQQVAEFFAGDATLFINGTPAQGREAITEVAQGFMAGFPDMKLSLVELLIRGETVIYHWNFVGSNTGPGGTGNAVDFSGYEEWTMGNDELIARSLGNFDEKEYHRQLHQGLP